MLSMYIFVYFPNPFHTKPCIKVSQVDSTDHLTWTKLSLNSKLFLHFYGGWIDANEKSLWMICIWPPASYLGPRVTHFTRNSWAHDWNLLKILLFLISNFYPNDLIRTQFCTCHGKGQWRGALMFSLICAWTKGFANNQDTSDLRCHRAHYDVTVICMDVMQRMTCGLWSRLLINPKYLYSVMNNTSKSPWQTN